MIDTSQSSAGKPSPVNRRGTRLREVAYQAIKEAILKGTLPPDQPLVEERLAAELSISRTPVREALAILEHEGLIETVPYQGLFVKAISVQDFIEMYQSVEIIEPELARRASNNATEDDLNALESLLVQAELYVPDNAPELLAACRMFQQRMGMIAGNQYLTALLLAVEERSDLYLISRWRELPPEKMLSAVADRRAILTALRERDAGAAEEASRMHARAACARWQALFSQK